MDRSDTSVNDRKPVVDPLLAVLWQDMLLQSYRLVQFVLQTGFLLCGVVLTVGVLWGGQRSSAYLSAVALLLLAILANVSMGRLLRLAIARSRDVHYWQRQVLHLEEVHRDHQLFAAFKREQLVESAAITVNALDDRAAGLIQASEPATRLLMDRFLVRILRTAWIVLLGSAIVALVSR